MSDQWVTKFGPRRVRKDLPTLQEAIFATEGITQDLESQVEIAASLMGLPSDRVRAEMLPKRKAGNRFIERKSCALRAVIVERRPSSRRV